LKSAWLSYIKSTVYPTQIRVTSERFSRVQQTVNASVAFFSLNIQRVDSSSLALEARLLG
jgi:hypothetical protein